MKKRISLARTLRRRHGGWGPGGRPSRGGRCDPDTDRRLRTDREGGRGSIEGGPRAGRDRVGQVLARGWARPKAGAIWRGTAPGAGGFEPPTAGLGTRCSIQAKPRALAVATRTGSLGYGPPGPKRVRRNRAHGLGPDEASASNRSYRWLTWGRKLDPSASKI